MSVLLLSLLLSGCRKSTPAAAIPKPNAEAAQYIAEGDASFREAHLYGWRKAEILYKKAYELSGSDESQKKLLLTRFLILARQADEDIPNSEAETIVREVCATDDGRNARCEIAKWYRKNRSAEPPDLKNVSAFGGEHPELDAYFKLRLSGDSFLQDPALEAISGQFSTSPLFLYLNPEKLRKRDPAEIELDYPHFAEAYECIAESHFQKKKYRTARTSFRKAIELIPDYTRAMNGLGNIYFFALEDYERALGYYKSALERDPTNTAAMFGIGAALHKLERYQESNDALDRMLAEDLLRSGRLSDAGYRYYSGEGRYLKAYNLHLMSKPAEARELVDIARQFLPDSEEVLDLSGVLFFKARKLEEARKDFLNVIARGNSNCNAQMHLGLIYHQMKQAGAEPASEERTGKGARGYLETWSLRDESPENKSLNYLLGACSCMESAIISLRGQIDSIPSLDLDPADKVLLKGRLENKLMDLRMSSSSNIELMINAASENMISGKVNYLNPMKEIFTRIRNR